ncbi:MAG: hypothetical protein HS116_08160 [Planctomycetes bacterium]|nr:hypothetical protein [Planctomycetota bacterium]
MGWLYDLLGLDRPHAVERLANWDWYAAAPWPAWAWVAAGLAFLALAGLSWLPANTMPTRLRVYTSLLRLAGCAMILALLVQLEARVSYVHSAPPRLAVLLDVSDSMQVADEAGSTRRAAAERMRTELAERLAGRVEIAPYCFGRELAANDEAPDLREQTRLFEALEEMLAREQDVQGVVVLTDGRDTTRNTGGFVAPKFAARGLPVYPVCLGSTEEVPVPRLKDMLTVPFVRLGDTLTLAARLEGGRKEEQQVRFKLFEAGKEEPLEIRGPLRLGETPLDVTFALVPTRAGLATYRIEAEGLKETAAERLLVSVHRVQVLDEKIKVLYLDIPRDERKILGHWLARDPVVDLAMLTMLPSGGWYAQGALKHKDVSAGLPAEEADLYAYDVIVLGDIPRSYFRQNGDLAETKMRWLADFVRRRGGGLITLGGRSVYEAGGYEDSPLAQILPFALQTTPKAQEPKEFQLVATPLGLSHPLMRLEGDPEANREAWDDLPPLEGCNRVGGVKPGAMLLATRPLSNETLPLMAAQHAGKGQVFSMAVDTTWNWEMQRPEQGKDYYRIFWGNAVRALAPDPRVRPGRPQIQATRDSAAVGETLALSTRLVDKLYLPVRQADLRVEVKSPTGRVWTIFPADGREAPGLYEYDVRLDEPGAWEVRSVYDGQEAVKMVHAGGSGQEFDDTSADRETLERFALATGGEVLDPARAVEELLAKLDGKAQVTERTQAVAIWNLPLVLFLLLGIVTLDCWLRKRSGMA